MTIDLQQLELEACQPVPLNANGFNSKVKIPFGLRANHIQQSMQEFIEFLGFVNTIEDSRHKLEYDLYYAKNYTPFLDLLIQIGRAHV